MKLTHHSHQSGFTLAEILTAMAIAVVIFAAIITASLAMQKSFNAVDHYFATHIQQVRIIDYLNRDVKRALIVTTSVDQQTVTLTIPKYIIQSGDAEAVSNPSLVGAMRSPTISTTTSGVQVNYGTATSTVVYSINGASILRTEDGVVTTIASSTDQLVPSTIDTILPTRKRQRWRSRFTRFLPAETSPTNALGQPSFLSLISEINDADKFMKVSFIQNERGNVLLCAVCTIFVVSLIAANVLLNCTARYNQASNQVRSWNEALYAAESGADMAYNEVRNVVFNPTNAFSTSNGWTPSGTTYSSGTTI